MEDTHHTDQFAAVISDRGLKGLHDSFLSLLDVSLFNSLCIPSLDNSFVVSSVFLSQVPGIEVIVCMPRDLLGLYLQVLGVIAIAGNVN